MEKCMQCGACCLAGGIGYRYRWLDADITDEQKATLREERGLHSDTKPTCEMLVFGPDGLACCLVHKLFGHDKKPRLCKNYQPTGEACQILKGANKNENTT